MKLNELTNKVQKNKKDRFIPLCASVYKLCKKSNNLRYYDQICRRILWAFEKDETLGDYIRIEQSNDLDIVLDEDGIMMFLDILEGYFDREDILSLWRYLREANKLRRMEYQFDHIFDHLPTADLKKVLANHESMIVESEHEEARQTVINKATSELKKRSQIVFFADFKKVGTVR